MKKILMSLCTCMLLAFLAPVCVSASDGKPANGGYTQVEAFDLQYDTVYRDRSFDGEKKYYKFKTKDAEGVYLISVETGVNADTSSAKQNLVVVDNYGTVIAKASAGGSATAFRNDPTRAANYKIMDIVLPLRDNIMMNSYYYFYLEGDDGVDQQRMDINNRLHVEYVPFRTADAFNMSYDNDEGTIKFDWDNIQTYNTYNPLASFDGFQIKMQYGKKTKIKNVGNGGVKSYSIKGTDKDLLALGYPQKKITMSLGCIQVYRSYFWDAKTVTKVFYAYPDYETKELKKNTSFSVNGIKYSITKAKGNGSGRVAVTGLTKKNKQKLKKLVIPKTVKYNGITYKVTSIKARAFKDNGKIESIEIGANVTTIGTEAFFNCVKAKNIKIRTKNLKKVYKDAFMKIPADSVIKVPSSHRSRYTRLLRSKCTIGVKFKKL